MNRRDLNHTIHTTRWPFWAFMVAVVCLFYQELVGILNKDDDIEHNAHLWLKKNRLSFVVRMFKRDGIILLYFKSGDWGEGGGGASMEGCTFVFYQFMYSSQLHTLKYLPQNNYYVILN